MKNTERNKFSRNSATLHGSLVQVCETGVLIIGDAGIGKSECSLELLSRGNRFVADDSVEIRSGGTAPVGSAPSITRGYLYIRGLGAFSVVDVFGVESILPQCEIGLVVELSRQVDEHIGSRIGPDFQTVQILGFDVAKLTIPVRTGRNLAVLVETAVKIQALGRSGLDASKDLLVEHTHLLLQK